VPVDRQYENIRAGMRDLFTDLGRIGALVTPELRSIPNPFHLCSSVAIVFNLLRWKNPRCR